MTLPLHTVLKGTYRLERIIGKGGMGEVYEAVHMRLAGRYAIKFLLSDYSRDPVVLERFKREAYVGSVLQHPNIVQVTDFDTTPEGLTYLVMELLKGSDLECVLQKEPQLPLARVVAIVKHIAYALQAAHDHGVVHRDLKPSNVFVVHGREDDFVKLLDFGISKIRSSRQSLTGDRVIGTPYYMSPEQAKGADDLDHRTDQFALAAMVYEMLAGQPPFSGNDALAILYQLAHEDPPKLSKFVVVPPAVDSVIRRGLSKDRRRRYDSVVEFAQAMEEAAFGGKKTRVGFTSPRYENAATVGDARRGDASARGLPEDAPSKPVAPTTFRTGAGELSRAIRSLHRKRVAVPMAAGAVALVLLVAVAVNRSANDKVAAPTAEIRSLPLPAVVIPAAAQPPVAHPPVASPAPASPKKASPPKAKRWVARAVVPPVAPSPRSATPPPVMVRPSPPVVCKREKEAWRRSKTLDNLEAAFDCLCTVGLEALSDYCGELAEAARPVERNRCQKLARKQCQ